MSTWKPIFIYSMREYFKFFVFLEWMKEMGYMTEIIREKLPLKERKKANYLNKV